MYVAIKWKYKENIVNWITATTGNTFPQKNLLELEEAIKYIYQGRIK
jgi:hypothetical protein